MENVLPLVESSTQAKTNILLTLIMPKPISIFHECKVIVIIICICVFIHKINKVSFNISYSLLNRVFLFDQPLSLIQPSYYFVISSKPYHLSNPWSPQSEAQVVGRKLAFERCFLLLVADSRFSEIFDSVKIY